jgi:diguanylate cyclase (GGDEF)-like protein
LAVGLPIEGLVGATIDEIAQRAINGVALRVCILIDRDLAIRWVTPSITTFLGYPVEEFVGMNALDVLHPDELGLVASILEFETVIDADFRSDIRFRTVLDLRVRHRSGEFRDLEASVFNFLNDPSIDMLLVDLQAPSQHRDLLQAIQLSYSGAELAETLRLVFTELTSSERWQPAAAIFDTRGTLVVATPNSPSPIGSADPNDYRSSWTLPIIEASNSTALGELRVWGHLDRPHPLDVSTSEVVARHAAVVIARHFALTELRDAAALDPLTGIPNRRALRSEFDARLRTGEEVAIAYLDLDGFKSVNDRLGHEAGDHVLVAIADRLRASLRAGDTVSRIGGDEFVILFGAPLPDPIVARERISRIICEPIHIGEVVVSVSASVGLSRGRSDADDLLRTADREMLSAKRSR